MPPLCSVGPWRPTNSKIMKSQEDCVQSLANVYAHEAQRISKASLESSSKGHFFVCTLSDKRGVHLDDMPCPSAAQRVTPRFLHRHHGTIRAIRKWTGWAWGPFIFLPSPRGQAPAPNIDAVSHTLKHEL